jgi:glutamate racemase
VVACNSASSAGYKVLLEFFRDQTLFVNVVDPLVEAVAARHFHRVGLIATKATVHSGVYQQQLAHLQPELQVGVLATPLLAPMIEEGFVENNISAAALDTYLSHPQLRDIEALLLACTHYPLIRPQIEAYYRRRVEIFDSTDVVAEAVWEKLSRRGLLSPERREAHQFFVSDYTTAFEETTRLFYREPIKLDYCPIW